MNTRQAIQPSNTPNVLSLSISSSRKRFVAALADGFRVFRLDNCLTTHHPSLPSPFGAAIAAALDDRYVAYVPTHKSEDGGGPNLVIFWDCVLERELTRFDLHEQVLGLRLSSKWMAIILQDRTILFQHEEIQPQAPPSPPPEDCSSPNSSELKGAIWRAPNRVHSLHNTSHNPFALCCLTNDLLILPARSTGQIQLISLHPKASTSKRVVRAHNSSLHCIALSPDGTLLVTTSEQGTLLRVFATSTLDQVAEFRRGLDHAIIYDLAFSPGNRWLASTSDKGTLHVFDLRPSEPIQVQTSAPTAAAPSHRQNRLSNPASVTPSTTSAPVAPSAAGQATSIQDYYALLPIPPPNLPPATGLTPSTFASAFKNAPFASRLLSDSRSAASHSFHLGSDPPHWQTGRPEYSWTVLPSGGRKRVRNEVLPRPGEPSGRAVKGVLTFMPAGLDGSDGDTNEESVRLVVIGGGVEGRWEEFQLRRGAGSEEWLVERRGFRRFLTRQFVE